MVDYYAIRGIPWHNKTGNQGEIASAEWESEMVKPMAELGHARPFYLPFIYPPNYDVPPSLNDQETILESFTALDGLWYWGCADLGDAVANSSLANIKACQQVCLSFEFRFFIEFVNF